MKRVKAASQRTKALRSGKKSIKSSGANSSHTYRVLRPSSLSPPQLKKRSDVLAAHADMMRNPKLRATQTAKDHGISVRDLWVYAPKAFTKESNGRIRATPDRYVRRMEIFGPNGPIVIKVRGSKARSQVAQFRNDVFAFLGGNATALDKWKGIKIQGNELLTDPEILLLLAQQDNLPEHFGSEQVIPYSGGTA